MTSTWLTTDNQPELLPSGASRANRVKPLSPRYGVPQIPCRMCGIRGSAATWDRPIFATDNFVVVPSKGAFLVGWLMIVPTKHVLSIAGLTEAHSAELEELITQVSDKQRRGFASPTIFEHGACVSGTTFGCGIDHAHVHLVPLPASIDLRAHAESALGQAFHHEAVSTGHPYLRLRQPGSSTWLSLSPTGPLPRQFFRQVIWEALGRPSASYDYDEAPCEAEVTETIRMLAAP